MLGDFQLASFSVLLWRVCMTRHTASGAMVSRNGSKHSLQL